MKISHFFIDRPIFATVLSIFALLLGLMSYLSLSIEQYPRITPPTIQVSAMYPGASAKVVAQTVATPLEQQINGVEDMLYLSSQSTNDGKLSLNITFKLGTDLDKAQVLVQNRVSTAEPLLPEPVRRLGVTIKKNSPDLMLVVNLYSPNDTYDQTYIANYATLQIQDILTRIDGVGEIFIFGASQYSMRIWLNPDRMASLNLTTTDVIQALSSQNVQVASGALNKQPMDPQDAFEISVETQGRLSTSKEFENLIVKSDAEGRTVFLKDIARVELGAETYSSRGYLGNKPAIALPIFQRPGSNALETAHAIIKTMERLSKNFPKDLKYTIVYNPTEFIAQSIHEVLKTIVEAIVLVVIVIVLFLQNWRAAAIPIVAIPISLIGTFAVMKTFGFSLNNLTLFGLVLAIGIVVDDAIVVVENIERLLKQGKSPQEAARETMTEVGSALIAMGLVLIAVFLPTVFIEGMSGKFYREFGVTIAVATLISVLVSLILSPTMSAAIFKPISPHEKNHSKFHFSINPLDFIFLIFNTGLKIVSYFYKKLIQYAIRLRWIMVGIYGVLMIFTYFQFSHIPTGFIPNQDQGYFIVAIQLPEGAALSRTDQIVQKATSIILSTPGVKNAVAFSGFSGATFSSASNAAAIFIVLEDFEVREAKGIPPDRLLNQLRGTLFAIDDAFIVVIPPPPVRGVGSGGGFKMMLQDRGGKGTAVLESAIWQMVGAANQTSAATSVFSFFENNTPQIYLDIDSTRSEKLGVPIARVFEALETYLGSSFVNDFSYLGRNYHVTAQADASYRKTPDDLTRIRVRNNQGQMVPLGTVAVLKETADSPRVQRYNLYPAAAIQGDTAPGHSTGEALNQMEQLTAQILPEGIDFEWTELALQQKLAGNTGTLAFILAVIFVFLLLAAQYESWVLPASVILIVPMCLFSALTGIQAAQMDNNILTQIGFVVLIGLASKNAILIVAFAKQNEELLGLDPVSAAIEAAKLRLRPILMTSFAFILGVVPLVFSEGAGAEMRRALGVTVFSGMLGVTLFGLLFTPVFYVLCRKLAHKIGSQGMS